MIVILDENIDSDEIHDVVRNNGYACTNVVDEDMGNTDDKIIIKVCINRNWVIVTQNIDDFRPIYKQESNHPGLICIKQPKTGKPGQIQYMQKMFNDLKNRGIHELKNKIVSVYADRVHVYPDDGPW